jgi:D-alanyl-D-alanine carboxypeptidase (penicillin-binding protein 5/6)
MRNHNGLLLRMAGVDGLKTGFTTASGYNLAASATRDGRRLIVVVLGGTSNANRDNEVADLIETGFSVLHRRDAGETITVAQNIFDPSSHPMVEAAAHSYSGPTAAVSPPIEATPLELASVSRMKPVPNPVQSRKAKAAAAIDSDDEDDAKAVPSLRPTQVADKDDAPADGRYMVQVGAFRQKTDAVSQIKTISAKFGQQFAAAETSIGDAVGGLFRARFTGLSADAAKQACSALKAKHLTCMIIAP